MRRARLMLLLVCLLAAACAAPQRSSRMTTEDFQEMAEAMAQSLLRSEALAQRGPQSEPWVVSIDHVRNLSSDVMTQAEQWAIMADLRGSLPIQALWDQKNIRFVLPPQRVVQIRSRDEADEFDASFASQRQPTHTMTATFRSVTRASPDGRGRIDWYYCEFEILELATGQTVWTDRFEYKRQARGHMWD